MSDKTIDVVQSGTSLGIGLRDEAEMGNIIPSDCVTQSEEATIASASQSLGDGAESSEY